MKVLQELWFDEGNQGRLIGIIVFQTEAGRRLIKIGTGGGLDREIDAEMIQRFGKEVSVEKLKAIIEVVK